MLSHILHPRYDYPHYSQYSHYYPSSDTTRRAPTSPRGRAYEHAYPGHDGHTIPSGYHTVPSGYHTIPTGHRQVSQQQARPHRQQSIDRSRMHTTTTPSRPDHRPTHSTSHGQVPHHGPKKKGGKAKFCKCFIAGHLHGNDSRTVTSKCIGRVHQTVPGYTPPMHPERCLRMTKSSFKSIKLDNLILLAMKLGIRYDDEMTKTEMQNLIAPRLPEQLKSRKFNWTGATATRKHKR